MNVYLREYPEDLKSGYGHVIKRLCNFLIVYNVQSFSP